MASLAEKFLDDVDSSESEGESHADEPARREQNGENVDVRQDPMKVDSSNSADTKSTVQRKVRDILGRVDQVSASKENDIDKVFSDGRTIDLEEYNLVVQSTEIIADIDEEIQSLDRKLKEAYSPNFPELETLIFNPLDYARVAKVAVNRDDLSKLDLRQILPSGTVITVQVTAASSAGRKLDEKEAEQVCRLCDALTSIDESKSRILEHIESRAGYMAPNLVEIVGGAVAARLMGIAGGLRQLAQMPSCNVKVLGKGKKALQGTSSATTRLHEGVIFTCPLVMNLPKQYRSKAGDVVTGKASLAARVDSCREQRDGSMGRKLRETLDAKFQKWQEPPPAKTAKPLPVPGDEAKRKHRGGKRARREKERLGITDMRRLANRVKFGEQEENLGNDLENEGYGMLGAEGSQKLRIQAKKTDSVSIAAKRRLAKEKKQAGASAAATLGIAGNSSLALSEPEGIQLGTVAPAPGGVGLGAIEANHGGKESTYFSASTPFLGVTKADRQIKKSEKR